MKTIAILCPYFGRWPEWIDYFLLSAAANPSVDFLFFTDCPRPAVEADNLRFYPFSFVEYKRMVSDVLRVDFSRANPYKLCDLKPFLGTLHADLVGGYDYYGFADVDVIFGDLRRFLTADVLCHNVVSTLPDRICGHFCLFRNTEANRRAHERIPRWREFLAHPEIQVLDEAKLTKVYLRHRKHPRWLRRLWALFDPMQRHNHFRDEHATILTPGPWWDGSMEHPQEWLWQPGSLTNATDGPREFMYLHFMNWKSARFLPSWRATKPAWAGIDIRGVSVDEARNGFRITPAGFLPLQHQASWAPTGQDWNPAPQTGGVQWSNS